jgi:putative oxidoreductase
MVWLKRRLYMARSIRSFLALIFILAGLRLFVGGDGTFTILQQIGLGEWLRYLAGAVAMSGGMLLLVPSRAVIGSAIATTLSVGALLLQAFLALGSPVFTVILAFLSGGALVQAQIEQPVATRR